MIPRNDGATNPLGGTFGLIHWNEGRDEADAKASKEAADDESGPIIGAGLERDTEAEHDTARDDARAATKNVSGRRAEERA